MFMRLKTALSAQKNLFLAFLARIVIARYDSKQGNLQAGATHPCLLSTRN